MPRYYVDWFYPNYAKRISTIKKVIKESGGKNIRLSNKFGWSNQPKVVCFNAYSKEKANSIQKALRKYLKRSCIVKLKDW